MAFLPVIVTWGVFVLVGLVRCACLSLVSRSSSFEINHNLCLISAFRVTGATSGAQVACRA